MMYSKKVIKHFQNPANMGKMINPDGAGEVGNPVCLLPKQNIHISNGIREIDKITVAERVLSSNGRYSKVNKTTKRDYSGKILAIKNKLGKICLTPDHLILSIKLLPGYKYLRTKNKKQLVPAWHHAEELKKGDIILYPVLKEKNNLNYKTISIPKSKWDFRSKEIPNKILINSDLLRLFGYFLSEGYVQDRPSRTFISFTLNIKEDEIVNDIKKISKKLFNLDIAVRRLPERKTVVIDLYSAKLARFFKEILKNGAANKIIPDFIMHLSPERQKPLIYGLWKGDGCLNLKRAGARGGYVTVSYKLAQQIKILLLRQKIVPSIYVDKEKKIKNVNHKEAYRIHIGQRDSLIKLCSILGVEYIPRSYASVDSWFDKNFCYTPITQIKELNYRGLVYNLEVSSTHSFTSDAFCLHNCGDLMNIYIKVAKNKKGQEIIKDIKFETLGCVAAIATSSMVTAMAKGKTLDEALKIKYSDIAEALGSLPPIKTHCADLAVKGLRAAIEDYKNNLKLKNQNEK